MSEFDKGEKGCILGAVVLYLLIVLGNLVFWSFIGWLVYLLVTHFTNG